MNAEFANDLKELSTLTGRMVVYNEHNRIDSTGLNTTHIVHTFIDVRVYDIASPIIQDKNLKVVEDTVKELIIKIKEGNTNG